MNSPAEMVEVGATIPWWTYFGSVSDIVVAAAAVVGLVFGLIQLQRIASANRNQGDIARAELLLEVDSRFEAEAMQASRLAIRSLRNHCDREAKRHRAGANDGDVAASSARLFSGQLNLENALWLRDKALERMNAEKQDRTARRGPRRGRIGS